MIQRVLRAVLDTLTEYRLTIRPNRYYGHQVQIEKKEGDR